MKIPDLNIGTRLAIGFATLMALAAVLLTVGITHLHEIGRLTTKVIDRDWVKAEAAHTVNSLTRANARRTMELFIVDDPREIAHIRNEIETNRNAISDALQLLDGMVTTPKGRETLTNINQTRNAYVVSFDKVASLIGDEKRAEAAQTLRAETLPLLDRIQGHVVDLVNLQRDLATSGGLAVHERISSAQNMMSVLGATIFLIGIPFAFWITTSITKPISHAVVVAKTVSSGDLTSHIAHHRSDETGQLLMALNEMNTSLENIVGNVRLRAESVATAARQIAAGNMDLSSRTESQASSLEETASSMEELISTVKQNADNVTQANTLANTAREAAIKGGAIVTKVVDTMYGIKGSTSRMEEIIATINGIAFQTNILALNAAVEAARAGEQGKGFAVVAAEVRTLAQRSAAAANEIRGLILDSVERISAGSALATDAGMAMSDIVLGVRRVTDIMNDITAAGSEQAAGLDQINQAIIHMDQVTQQNTALVEESAVAAQSLQEQAAELAMAVRSFKLHREAATIESDSQTLLVEASGTLSRTESTRNLLTYS